MGNTGADKYEITAREIHENQFSTFLQQMEDDLWKSDSCGLDSERKKVLASSHGALACTFMDLGVFGSVGTHFPSEKLILPYFSSLSMVAILVCDSHRQAGSSNPDPQLKSNWGQLSSTFHVEQPETQIEWKFESMTYQRTDGRTDGRTS